MSIYTEDLPEYGDLMLVEEYLVAIRGHWFVDSDGVGAPVKNNKTTKGIEYWIYPSNKGKDIPKDATHIIWFNK